MFIWQYSAHAIIANVFTNILAAARTIAVTSNFNFPSYALLTSFHAIAVLSFKTVFHGPHHF